MIDRNSTATTLDDSEFSRALACSPEGLELLKTDGVSESWDQGRDVVAARDDLRDAAWAHQLWH